MKRICLIFLILFCVFMMIGLKVYIRDNVTVGWDGIEYTGDGVVTYEVYVQDTETELFTFVGETALYEYNFDVPLGPQQNACVRTKVVDDEGEHFSLMCMSYDEANPIPFGLLQAVPAPANLRLK